MVSIFVFKRIVRTRIIGVCFVNDFLSLKYQIFLYISLKYQIFLYISLKYQIFFISARLRLSPMSQKSQSKKPELGALNLNWKAKCHGWIARESQRNKCYQHELMMMRRRNISLVHWIKSEDWIFSLLINAPTIRPVKKSGSQIWRERMKLKINNHKVNVRSPRGK